MDDLEALLVSVCLQRMHILLLWLLALLSLLHTLLMLLCQQLQLLVTGGSVNFKCSALIC